MSDVNFVAEKTIRQLARVDNMPSDLRRCVHEFGLPIVDSCLTYGIKNPSSIRQHIREIWVGTRDTGSQKQKGHSGLVSRLDWVLTQNNSPINAMTLLRIIDQSDFVLVPRTPWGCMVNASMATVSGFDVHCTKQEKHRARITAAIRAAMKYAWPHLDR